MPVRGSGVSRVARAVARGEGDWVDVPPSLRDAIVMALAQSSAAPLGDAPNVATSSAAPACGPMAVHGSPSAVYFPTATAPPPLTEAAVQSSIETFEDAAWVRDEAVRSYAEFHNNLESLHAAMRAQLRPVWKTSMQLRPSILADVRDECQLNRRDNIPDGVPITAHAAQHIALQEEILDDLEDTLQTLRNTSVRFAAHFLSDEEKISMGANPAYLRAPDIDREVSVGTTAVAQRDSRSPHRAGTPRGGAAGAATNGHAAGPSAETPTRDDTSQRHRRPSEGHHATARAPSPRHHRHHPTHRSGPAAVAGLVRSRPNRHAAGSATSSSSTSSASAPGAAATSSGGEDPLLAELRRQYQRRTRELAARDEVDGARAPARTTATAAAASSTARNGQHTHQRPERSRRTSSAAQVETPRSRSRSSSSSAHSTSASASTSTLSNRDTRHRQHRPRRHR